jgi:hypothetical protein
VDRVVSILRQRSRGACTTRPTAPCASTRRTVALVYRVRPSHQHVFFSTHRSAVWLSISTATKLLCSFFLQSQVTAQRRCRRSSSGLLQRRQERPRRSTAPPTRSSRLLRPPVRAARRGDSTAACGRGRGGSGGRRSGTRTGRRASGSAPSTPPRPPRAPTTPPRSASAAAAPSSTSPSPPPSRPRRRRPGRRRCSSRSRRSAPPAVDQLVCLQEWQARHFHLLRSAGSAAAIRRRRRAGTAARTRRGGGTIQVDQRQRQGHRCHLQVRLIRRGAAQATMTWGGTVNCRSCLMCGGQPVQTAPARVAWANWTAQDVKRPTWLLTTKPTGFLVLLFLKEFYADFSQNNDETLNFYEFFVIL